jgi:hypothetical protein
LIATSHGVAVIPTVFPTEDWMWSGAPRVRPVE